MSPLPLLTRLWFAWVCYFRILLDGAYAAKLLSAGPRAELPAPAPSKVERVEEAEKAERAKTPSPGPTSTEAALQLLALLQREGRLVDFLEEDISSFPDADIGAAARVVHAGCRRALREHLRLEPVRSDAEGAKIVVPDGFDAAEVKLTGNVQGKGPYTGTVRHRGWRAAELTLPTAIAGHDARIIAQAEVEL